MLMTAPMEAKAADLLYIVLRKCSSNLLFKGTNYEKAYFKSYCTICGFQILYYFSKNKMSQFYDANSHSKKNVEAVLGF